MGLIQRFQNWTSSHNPVWLALIRVAVGVSLLLKGVSFLDSNSKELRENILQSSLSMHVDLLANAIPWIHIAGGFLIFLGLFTRFAAFIQIPVLLGAFLFINVEKFSARIPDLSFSIILLLLLVVFVVEGSGPISLSRYFKDDER